MYMTFEYSHDGKVIDRYERMVGQVPIMVKVNIILKCMKTL